MQNPSADPTQAPLKKFLEAFPAGPLGVEEAAIDHLPGRCLAEDIKAPSDSPPYSRSIIEGYLVNISETEAASDQNPVVMRIAGRIDPGQSGIKAVKPETAFEVVTGSYVPPTVGLGVVRMMEAAREGEQITVRKPVQDGSNLEQQGCEVKKGATVMRKGRRIQPEDITALAGLAVLTAQVARLPRVAIFSSGNEVIPPTQPMKPGMIWDANSYGLSALVTAEGGEPQFMGIMKDDFDVFKDHLKRALADADMILISGGTAVGGRDFIADLIQSLGPPGVVVNGVPMRGGKPLVMGIVGQKPIVCVAGHPPEAVRGFQIFGRPALSRLLGETEPA